MTVDRLRQLFLKPRNDWRFAPFWFLNHELNEDETRWQIREMRRKGVGGFILHARHGLITPYMSEAWMRQMEVAIEEAERLGMKAYLYDENNWPSGPADGRVIEEHPEFRMSGLHLSQQFDVAGGSKVARELSFSDELISVVAVPLQDGQPAGFPEAAVDLTPIAQDGRLEWTPPRGDWRVYVLSRRFFVGLFFGGYLDTLNKDAVAEFVRLTHKTYAERFQQRFGGTVAGIFTDEPTMNFNGPDAAPWTPTLPAEFEWRKGRALRPLLPALFADVGPAAAKIRCDFYDVASAMYQEAYFKQIYDYCDKMRISTMGHVMFEGELVEHVRQQGDWFRPARYMHWGGVDQLCDLRWSSRDEHLNNLVGPKFASSAAHLLEKPITGCECFGLAGQWGIDLRTLKSIADWLVALGVNVLEPHAFYYSIQGFRKWECPPGEFYQSPFWAYYNHLADYVGRLCELFHGGRHVADVALLYPVKSMWAELSPHANPTTNALVDNFELTAKTLIRLNYDFDFVSEEMLEKADLRDGRITVKGERGKALESYKVLVMPACTTIAKATVGRLRRFVEGGGKIVATGVLPTKFADAEPDDTPAADLSALFGEDYRLSQQLARKRKAVVSADVSPGWSGGMLVGLPEGLDEREAEAALAPVLDSVIESDVDVRDEHGEGIGDIVHYHYVRDDRHFLLIVNTSRERAYSADISVAVTGVPTLWDAETGDTKPLHQWRREGGRIAFPMRLAPTQSAVVCVDPAEDAEPPHILDSDVCVERMTERAVEGITDRGGARSVTLCADGREERLQAKCARPPAPVVLDDEWEFATDRPNVLPLTEWSCRLRADVWGRDAAGDGHVYSATVESETDLAEARLCLDGLAIERVWRGSAPVDFRVFVNDEPVGEFAKGEYLDHYIWEAPINGLVRAGKNEVRVETAGHLYETPNLAHPILLVGRFALAKRGRRRILIEEPTKLAGPWDAAGYPFYSGVATYRQEVNLARRHLVGKLRLQLEAVGDLADVWVNGKQAGVRCWEPLSVDITQHARQGRNEIVVKVANSLQNILCQRPKPSGLLGPVRIVPYAKVRFRRR